MDKSLLTISDVIKINDNEINELYKVIQFDYFVFCFNKIFNIELFN
jgi:hypothetical protein